MKIAYERILAETPKFFKTLRMFSSTLSAALTAGWGAINMTGMQLGFPYESILKYAIVISTTIAAFTFLPTTDKDLSQK
jgi:hypothetical protein